ncbi:MAG: septal ring lytic transglycosylase RlpA family protein [Legionellales bacterium]|nr:septal ring lytic transglycosylase RlpA family protein [Legionellales bacterium]
MRLLRSRLRATIHFLFGLLGNHVVLKQLAGLCGILLFITSCSMVGNQSQEDGPPLGNIDYQSIPNAVPQVLPKSRYGNPDSYVVFGRRYYVLNSAYGYKQRGIASWYGTKFHARRTSSGEPYNMLAMTAASKVLPIPCFAKVTNLENGRQVIVKVNDRGPFKENRIMDLSYVAAKKLGIVGRGTGLVEVETIDARTWNRHSLNTVATHVVPHGHPKIYMQIGSFSNEHNAQQLANRIRSISHREIHILKTDINHRVIYRVQIGPLGNVDESDALTSRLKHLHLGTPWTVIR